MLWRLSRTNLASAVGHAELLASGGRQTCCRVLLGIGLGHIELGLGCRSELLEEDCYRLRSS